MKTRKMNDNQHIPTGYKPSPLGPIPEDWEVKRLGEICDYVDYRGKSPDKVSNGVFLVTAKNIREGFIDYEISKEYIPKEDFEIVMRRGKAEVGDVLITTEAPLGHVAQIDNPNIALAQRVIKYRGKGNILNTFLKYFLMSETFQAILIANATGSTALGIKGSRLHQLQIIVPSINEQEKIISLLQLWDTAIAKQTALIEQLTLRKRGLMQQLLTGKKRLKGFEGEWKEVRLGDVASINRGGSPRPIEDYITDGEGYNWIKIGDVGVDAKYITSTEEKIIKEGLSKTRFVKSGDFILSNSMSFGRPYILKIDGCIHDGWLVIQEYSQTFNIDFLYYILGYDTTLAQYKSMAAGSGVLNLNKEIVKEVQLRIPSIDEQIVIASILVNADKEIEIQKQKLAAMQEQKKGLMQVLLTGKRRISHER